MSVVQIVAALLGSIFGIWLYRVANDFHKLIRKASAALDRDQHMLDSIVEVPVTDHVEDDSPQFAIDMSLDERDATLQFIEQFREIRKHYGMD